MSVFFPFCFCFVDFFVYKMWLSLCHVEEREAGKECDEFLASF